MALKTSKEYVESLAKMDRNIWFQGKKIEDPIHHPLLVPSRKCLEDSYDMALMPEYEDLMTATSQFTGHKINRFNHVYATKEDLIKKVKMQRLMGQRTGSCFQRCVIMDMANAFYPTTYEIDEKYGTHYFERFKEFIIKCQDEDLIVAGALIFGNLITITQVSQTLVNFVSEQQIPANLVLLIMCLLFVVLGMFLEVVSIMYITMPIVYPLMTSLGFDGIWFGVFVTLLMEMALITPPVGLNTFVIQGISGEPMLKVIKGVLPFMALLAVGLVILFLFPDLATWLPSQMSG